MSSIISKQRIHELMRFFDSEIKESDTESLLSRLIHEVTEIGYQPSQEWVEEKRTCWLAYLPEDITGWEYYILNRKRDSIAPVLLEKLIDPMTSDLPLREIYGRITSMKSICRTEDEIPIDRITQLFHEIEVFHPDIDLDLSGDRNCQSLLEKLSRIVSSFELPEYSGKSISGSILKFIVWLEETFKLRIMFDEFTILHSQSGRLCDIIQNYIEPEKYYYGKSPSLKYFLSGIYRTACHLDEY